MNSVSNISGAAGNAGLPGKTTAVNDNSFGNTLKGFLGDVNGLITEAGASVEKMAAGEVTDIHEVMIAAEKASIGLELVMEVRNKLMESYKEIMRMQI